MIKLNKEPYFYLFPTAILSAVIGVSLWLLFQLQWIAYYPRNSHAALMFFCFFSAYVSGFLMTAVPKMTKTKSALKTEIIIPIGLIVFQWVANLADLPKVAVSIYAVQLLFLCVFVLRRFKSRKQTPFEGFIFVPFAFAMAFFVLGSYLVSSTGINISLVYALSGEAFILNLICGLGSRLIPAISRVASAAAPDGVANKNTILGLVIFALFLNLTFVFEFMAVLKEYIYIMRAALLIFYAIKFFKILEKPLVRTYLGWGLKFSVGGLVLGYLMAGFDFNNYLAGMHLAYIGGFTLLTLMISTRVTLAHGGKNLNIELKSKAILSIIAFTLVAAIFRYAAGINSLSVSIAVGAVLYIASLMMWLIKIY